MSSPRDLALRFLPGMVRSLLSGAKALEMLRAQGLGYRTAVFYKDWAEAVSAVGFEARVERLPEGAKVPYWWATETTSHLSEKYHCIIEATLWNRKEKKEDVFPFRMATGKLASREDVLAAAPHHPAITKQAEYTDVRGLKWVGLEKSL